MCLTEEQCNDFKNEVFTIFSPYSAEVHCTEFTSPSCLDLCFLVSPSPLTEKEMEEEKQKQKKHHDRYTQEQTFREYEEDYGFKTYFAIDLQQAITIKKQKNLRELQTNVTESLIRIHSNVKIYIQFDNLYVYYTIKPLDILKTSIEECKNQLLHLSKKQIKKQKQPLEEKIKQLEHEILSHWLSNESKLFLIK